MRVAGPPVELATAPGAVAAGVRQVVEASAPAHRFPIAAAGRYGELGRLGRHGPRRGGPSRAAGGGRGGGPPRARQLGSAHPAGVADRQAGGSRADQSGIGTRLFLSHRTVGFHLYRVFPKLGISSRGQLSAIDLGDD
ncbi:LuxR C-terminal-related transcriptional regulator [Catenulispora subtropica]|uniref:LuxR C-terminal-related transcriptional regulator n=1 Tax=Catenulispora subtropica TaxID=450798 RepID=UPI0031D50F32